MNRGEKIAELRKKHGMTQDDLGKAMNVSYQAVSKWERDESQPDFETMTKIAHLFNVPLSHFANEEESVKNDPAPPAQKTLAGTCTECGRAVYEGEEGEASPKLLCAACAEQKRQAEDDRRRKEEQLREEERIRLEAERPSLEREMKKDAAIDFVKNYLGLIIGLVAALASAVAITVFAFLSDSSDDAFFLGFLLVLVPIAVFGLTDSLVEKLMWIHDGDDGPEHGVVFSLIAAAAFAVVLFALTLTFYLAIDNNFLFLVTMIVAPILSFTFVSQYLWGGSVQEIFTCGGFTFKIPMILFTLDVDGLVFLILARIFLGILAVIIYLITALFFALVAMLGSVFLFIPSLSIRLARRRKEKSESGTTLKS